MFNQSKSEYPENEFIFDWKKILPAFFLILITSFTAYYPALHNELVWDDTFIINYYLHHLHSFANLFDPFFQIYSRPATSLSLLLDYSFWYKDPVGYHLSNLIIHGATGILFFVILSLLEIPYLLSLSAALLFITHPIHLENVAWIAGRTDMLATFFILLFFLSFYLWAEKMDHSLFIPMILFGWFAILSKEIGLLCSFLVLPYLWLFKKYPLIGKGLLLCLILLVPPLIIKAWALNSYSLSAKISGIPWDFVIHLFSALGFYVIKTVYPFPIQPVIPEIPVSWSFFLTGFFSSSFFIYYFSKGTNPWGRFGATLFFLSILMALPPVFTNLSATPLAERYLYLPSLLFIGLLIGFIRHSVYPFLKAWRRNWLYLFFFALIFFNGWVCFVGSPTWKNNLVFWHQVKKQTGYWMVDHQLGVEYLRKGDLDRAEKHLVLGYMNGGNQNPVHQATYFENRGVIFSRKGRLDLAEPYLKNSVLTSPNPSNLNNLAIFYLMRYARDPQKDKAWLDLAYQNLKRAYKARPYDLDILLNLGMVYTKYGDPRQGLRFFNRVSALDPRSPQGAKAMAWSLSLENMR